MEIIPPEAAQVMSLAPVSSGTGPLMPGSSALPSSAPMLVVSPAIAGKEDGENRKINVESADKTSVSSPRLASIASSLLGATALDSFSDKEKESPVGQNLEQHSTDNIALPLRRPSGERDKRLSTHIGQTLAFVGASSEPNTGSVETFVTTNSSSEKPQHIVLPKDSNKTPSISPESVSHTKTLIQVHTPSSSKTTPNICSVTSESEGNRAPANVPNLISGGGQKVTLVTRQNDPDHVSIVLNPSTGLDSEITSAPAASSSSILTPGSIDVSHIDGSKTSQENKPQSAKNDSATVSSSSAPSSTANGGGSRKGKKHPRKASKDSINISYTSAEEILETGAPSKRSRRASASKPPTEKTVNISSSANDKDVMKRSDSFQTKSVSYCQRTKTSCSSNQEKIHNREEADTKKQESNFNEGKLSKDMRLPLYDGNTDLPNSPSERLVKEPAKLMVCSSDVQLVPAHTVIDKSVLPEKEEYQIELRKDEKGLGITVAGYICEKGRYKTHSSC